MNMLRDKFGAVPDLPPQIFKFGLVTHDRNARAFEPFIAAHFSDEEAWHALFTDQEHLEDVKVVYGNRMGREKKKRKVNERQGVLV